MLSLVVCIPPAPFQASDVPVVLCDVTLIRFHSVVHQWLQSSVSPRVRRSLQLSFPNPSCIASREFLQSVSESASPSKMCHIWAPLVHTCSKPVCVCVCACVCLHICAYKNTSFLGDLHHRSIIITRSAAISQKKKKCILAYTVALECDRNHLHLVQTACAELLLWRHVRRAKGEAVCYTTQRSAT